MEEIDRLAHHMRRFEYVDADDTLESRLKRAGFDQDDRKVRLFARLFEEIQDLPRVDALVAQDAPAGLLVAHARG